MVGKMAQDVGIVWMCCGVIRISFGWFLSVQFLHALVFLWKTFLWLLYFKLIIMLWILFTKLPRHRLFIECKSPCHKLHSLIIPCIAIILFSRYYIALYPGSRWVGLPRAWVRGYVLQCSKECIQEIPNQTSAASCTFQLFIYASKNFDHSNHSRG